MYLYTLPIRFCLKLNKLVSISTKKEEEKKKGLHGEVVKLMNESMGQVL